MSSSPILPPPEHLKAICFEPIDFVMDDPAAQAGVCFADCDPFLSELDAAEANAIAIAENPRNASITIPISDGSFIAPMGGEPSNLAMMTAQFWNPGRKLKVGFLAGSDWQKSKVKQYAPAWAEYGNFSFEFVDTPSSECDFLIDFNPRLGSWSYIGTVCSYYSNQKKATMNLGWIDKGKPEEHLRQVVLHEFGHALGAVHEHESPFTNIPWNKEAVYQALGGKPNYWDRAKVDQNMFTKYTLDTVQATTFDPKSIMLYQYPASWTTNGSGTSFNSDLSESDKKYIKFCYPPNELDVGQFNTQQLRPWNQPTLENSDVLHFSKKYQTPPKVALALTQLDMDKSKNIRVAASAADVTNESFRVKLNSWADSVFYMGGLSYLEIGPAFDYLQTGVFNTTEVSPWQEARPHIVHRINFDRAFSSPPQVLVFFNAVDIDNSHNHRVKTYVENVDEHGFTLHVETWADTQLYMAGVTWIAHPADQANVASGKFSTMDVRRWDQPVPDTSGTTTFKVAGKSGGFGKTPKVMMGLSALDYDVGSNLRVRISTSLVTKDSFTWHGQSWADSKAYLIEGNYFAWE